MLETKIALPKIAEIINQANWSFNNYDFYILLFFSLIILLSLTWFRHKMLALLFSFYSSYLIILFFPFSQWLQNVDKEIITKIKFFVFIGLIVILFFLFSRYRVLGSPSGGVIKNFVFVLFYGILNAGLFLSLLILFLPFNLINKFSGTSLKILASAEARFTWIILPIIFLFFFNKKKKGPGRPSLY